LNSGIPPGAPEVAAPVYLVRGDDQALIAQAARVLIDRLVGDSSVALVVEEHGGPGADEIEIGRVLDGYTTPPFLVSRRVVVVRDAGKLNAADAARLVDVLADPMPAAVLVLVAGGGTVPQALTKKVGAVGEIVDAAVGTGRERSRWLTQHAKDAPVHLDAAATARLGEHLGQDLGRLEGILATLAAAYGTGANVNLERLEPFLGSAGAVPPWDLTDAVDTGNTDEALAGLQRMTNAGGRAAPEILAILHRHYADLLRLDGADITDPDEAATLLGIRSSYVAKKALGQSRSLGSERIGQAVRFVADADLDLKGRTGLSHELVLEILVARLSRLSRTRVGRR
jgi:DNA polymerase III subunit delta